MRAMPGDPSVLPLSATMISPIMPAARIVAAALSIHVPSVSASFKHGSSTETSTVAADVESVKLSGSETRTELIARWRVGKLRALQCVGNRAARKLRGGIVGLL